MKTLIKDTLVWGSFLWLIGYILGIVLFAVVPPAAIGWIISPVGILLTLWVLHKKISVRPLGDYLTISIIWTSVAIILDYFLLVKLFKPADGYYKLDVYFYYLSTFALPLIVGYYKGYSPKKV